MMLILFILVAVFRPSISCSEKPFIYENNTKSITINEGDTARLECYAGGEPNAPIKWHRELRGNNTKPILFLPNGKTVSYGNVLEIPSIAYHQHGRYVCSVKNACGNDFKHIQVRVNYHPVIYSTDILESERANSLELRCSAESASPPKIRWTKNDVDIQPSEHIKIINKQKFDDIFISTLKISDNYFNESQFIYKCEFENAFGTKFKTLKFSAYKNDR